MNDKKYLEVLTSENDLGSKYNLVVGNHTFYFHKENDEDNTALKQQETDRMERVRLEREEMERKEREKIDIRKNHLISADYEPSRFIHSLYVDRASIRSESGRGDRFYTNDFTFKPGVNLLFGGNGQGKSSLIKYISVFGNGNFDPYGSFEELVLDYCKMIKSKGKAKIYSFCNSKNNERYNHEPDNAFSFMRHMQSNERSEGQTVMQSVSDFLYCLESDEYVPADEDTVVFVDEIDSGLDAIACRYLVNRIKKILARKPKIQLFLAFNQYEMSKLDTQWLNVCTGKFEDCPKSYEEYFERLNANKRKYKRKVDSEVRK